jgi:hypothetical protein
VKRSDILAIGLTVLLGAFFGVPMFRNAYQWAYQALPLLVTFIKFALLATGGELVAQRISTGRYLNRGFGIIPKMIVWGILGIGIYWAFQLYSRGAPAILPPIAHPGSFRARLVIAFLCSLSMNITFAPMMMMTHHLSDTYIAEHSGRFPLRGFAVLPLLKQIDWPKMWGFVFKKTIPLFWIPAHTISFLLPEQFRTLFAAALSVVLGVFLGALKQRNCPTSFVLTQQKSLQEVIGPAQVTHE